MMMVPLLSPDQKNGEDRVQNILNESVVALHEKPTDVDSLASDLNISKITDGLFLCSALSVHSSTLRLLGVTCVINAAKELPNTPLPDDVDIEYCKIDVRDSTDENIGSVFDSTSDLIHRHQQGRHCYNQITSPSPFPEKQGRVLVHCIAGVSRSATLCIAYLMKYYRLSLLDAYNYTKSRRPIVRPNCGFFKQLVQYEKDLFGTNTVSLVYNTSLKMEIPDVYDVEYNTRVNCFRKKCHTRDV